MFLIAAGGLFTSCIKNEEPNGIEQVRIAKAEYIKALAALENANKAVIEAEAAFKQAQAGYENQLTLLLAAQTKEQELKNELRELENKLKQLEYQKAQALLDDEISYNKALNQLNLQLKQAELDQFLAALEAQALLSAEELEHLKQLNVIELQVKQAELAALLANNEITLKLGNASVSLKEEELRALIALNTHNEAINALALLLAEEQNKKDIEDIKNEIAAAKAQATIDALKAQEDYAKAEAALRKALKDIAANELVLTEAEAKIVSDATTNYLTALSNYNTALAEYNKAVADANENEYWDVKDLEAKYTKDLEDAVENYAMWAETYAYFQNLAAEPATWMAEWKEYKDKIDSLNHELHKMEAQSVKDMVDYNNQYIQLFAAMQEALDAEELQEPVDPADTFEVLCTVDLPQNDFLINQWKNWMAHFNPTVTFDGFEMTVDGKLSDVEKAIYQQEDVTGESVFYPGMREVLETFERELVIADNALLAEHIKDLTAAKKRADSLYAAHKKILKNGRAAYVAKEQAAYDKAKVALDTAQAQYEKAKKDSAAAEAAAKKDLNDALAKNKQDSIDKVDGMKKKVTDAANDFIWNINYCFGTIGGNDMDTTNVFAAIKAYAEVLEELGSEQAVIYTYAGKDASDKVLIDTVRIVDLKKEDFEKNGLIADKAFTRPVAQNVPAAHFIEANKGTIDYLEAVAYVVRILSWFDNNPDTWNDTTDLDLTTMFINGDTVEDAVKPSGDIMKKIIADAAKAKTTADNAAKKAYQDVLTAQNKLVTAAKKALDAAVIALNKAEAALQAKIDEFNEIYDQFWGYTAGTTSCGLTGSAFPNAAGDDSLQVIWGDGLDGLENTFLDPHPVVFFTKIPFGSGRYGLNPNNILPNDDLSIILDNLDPNANRNPNNSFIFFHDDETEFYQTLYLHMWLSWYENNVDNMSALAALRKAVDKVEAEYKAVVAEKEAEIAAYEKAVEEFEAAIIAFTGAEDATEAKAVYAELYTFFNADADHLEILFDNNAPVYSSFIDTFVNFNKGEWTENILGTVKELFDQYMVTGNGLFPEWVKNVKDQVSSIKRQINDADLILGELDSIYDACLAHVALNNDPTVHFTPGSDFEKSYKNLLASIEKKMEAAEKQIETANKALEMWKLGADAAQVAAYAKEQSLAYYAEALKVAKTELEYLKAKYEEVIAKYIATNNN